MHTPLCHFILLSSHSATLDLDVSEIARAAEFFLSDGVIVTGKSTGSPADTAELECVREAVSLPLLVGSGVTADNLDEYITRVDGLIVGSEFKVDGLWYNDVDINRVKRLMHRKKELSNTR